MAIRIVRNDAGNCINFYGSSNPTHWNACLSGEVDSNDNTLVNIINDIKTAGAGTKQYEFFRVPYTDFVDADGQPFANAADTAAYISLNGNVSAPTTISAQYQGTWDASSNTPDISDTGSFTNGDWYYVTTAGTYESQSYNVNDEIRYNASASLWQRIPYAGALVEFDSTRVLLNTNASVYADETRGESAPSGTEQGWYFKNENTGQKINWYFVGNQNTAYEMTRDTIKNGWARIKFITNGPVFFVLYTTPLFDGHDASWYRSRYVYSIDTLSPLQFSGLTANQEVIVYWGEEPTNHPTLSRIKLDLDSDFSTLSTHADITNDAIYTMALATDSSDAVDSIEMVVKELGFKNGQYNSNFPLETTLEATPANNSVVTSFSKDSLNDTILLNSGDYYPHNVLRAVADTDTNTIKLVSAYVTPPNDEKVFHDNIVFENVVIGGEEQSDDINAVVNALNQYFNQLPPGVTPEAPTPVVDITGSSVTLLNTSASGNVYVTDPIGDAVAAGVGSHYHRQNVYTLDTLNDAGEYYTFSIKGEGIMGMGLYDKDSDDVSELSNTSLGSNGAYGYLWSVWVHPTPNGPWTTYGSNPSFSYLEGWNGSNGKRFSDNAGWQDNDVVNMKVGINADSFAYIAYWSPNHNEWVDIARSSYKLSENTGGYGLAIKFADTNGTLYSTPKIHAIEDATIEPVWYAIESPDGYWSYPLFVDEVTANYVDEVYGTATSGSGSANANTYPDDVQTRTWWMPDTLQNRGITTAPTENSGSPYADVTWNIIPTNDDALFAPAAFTIPDLTVDEGATINYQIAPQDASFTTAYSIAQNEHSGSIVGIPVTMQPVAGGVTIHGTAPQVTGSYAVDSNPTDTYEVTVTRDNGYGSTQATFNIIVNNLTAPTLNLTGFTSVGTIPPLDSDTLDSGSVVEFDEDLTKNHRFLIPISWINTYVLPSLTDDGDAIYVGVRSGSVGTLEDGIVDSDWKAYIKWERSGSLHKSVIYADTKDEVNVNSLTASPYDYAFEADDHGHLYVIACNANAIYTEPGLDYGGQFSRSVETSGSAPHTITLVTKDCTMDLDIDDITEIVIPRADNWIQVTEVGAHVLNFDGSATFPTLQAGYTYRLLVADVEWDDQATLTHLHGDENIRFTADGTTEYVMDNVTRSGTPGDADAYFEFTVPSDVPPIWWYTDHTGVNQNNGVTTAGSTYVTPVTGVTLEGPAINQTGSNLFNDPAVDADGVVWGWLSIDEQLSAGERLVLDNAFMVDLTDAMPDNSGIFIGVKSGTWTENYRNNSIANATYAGARFAIYRYSAADIRVFGNIIGATTIGRNFGTNGIANTGLELAFEITSDGNDIRLMMKSTGTGYNGLDNVNSTAYDDWSSSYKTSTGNQGFGITSLDIMILGDGNVSGTAASGEMDTADVDWTGLSEITVPTPAVSNLTSWTKAVDFNGSSERAVQVTQDSNRIPMKMNGQASLITGTPTSGYTSNNTSAKPWSTAVVFKIDGNSSNQHIWNLGEGAGDNDDNIYLRVDAAQNLYFGWGRSGALNECRIATAISSAFWYAVYIGHDGRRWASAGATAGNLYQTFDIRMMSSHDNFGSSWDAGTYNDWNQVSSTTGGRMDRNFTGEMTIGGRGANRSFHGKVASFVTTTLRRGVAMPTVAEIEMMITDPTKWLQDYKVGNPFRLPWQASDAGFNFSLNDGSSSYSTQVWLMGDGTNDSYSNMIRNQVLPTDQNYTKLNLISMVSNDIENVNIGGLS